MITNQMKQKNASAQSVIGIDIGSVSISVVQTDLAGNILQKTCVLHEGQIKDSLLNVLKG